MKEFIHQDWRTQEFRIPAGSVGIGGSQTGIYPLDSPGGWQLLGLTPVKNPMIQTRESNFFFRSWRIISVLYLFQKKSI